MDMITIVILFALLCVPIVLGWLAKSTFRVHRGPTSCSACKYALSGHESKDLHITGKCPECGCTLSDKSVFLQDATYHKPARLWIVIPCITLLLVPPALIAWVVLGFFVGLGWEVAGVIVTIAFPFVVVWAIRASQKQTKKLAGDALPLPTKQDPPIDPVRATMLIANYLNNQAPPPSTPPPA